MTKGALARKTVSVTFVGDASPTEVDVAVLDSAQEAEALAGALAFAKARGSTDARDGDPLYDLGLWVHTCLLACMDPESPAGAPVPFFSNIEEMLRSKRVTPEHFAYLYEMQEEWQEEHAPYVRQLSDGEVMTRAVRIAAGELLPFLELRPGTRWNFTRTLAFQYVASLAPKLQSGGPFDSATNNVTDPS